MCTSLEHLNYGLIISSNKLVIGKRKKIALDTVYVILNAT